MEDSLSPLQCLVPTGTDSKFLIHSFKYFIALFFCFWNSQTEEVKISAKQKLGADGRRSVRPAHVVPEPVNEWSLREKLALASAVQQSGDQNWGTVSRSIRGFAERPRPADWFSQKNCAVQYNKLLETYEPPKRKRGEQETAVQAIVKNLTAQYIAFLERAIPLGKEKYEKKLSKIKDLETGRIPDETVGQMYDKFMKSRVCPVEVFDDDDQYTDIDDDEDDTEADETSVAGASTMHETNSEEPTSSTSVNMEIGIDTEITVETLQEEPKTPAIEGNKLPEISSSSPISPELKHLVHTAIAGTDEKDRSRVGVPGGSPTLSMLLELPPRGHGEPLPQLPVLVHNPVTELSKTDDDLAQEASETSSSEPNLVPNPFFRSIPTIENDNSQTEVLPGNPLFPVVPDDFLCFAAEEENSSKPANLEVQLKKEELFQSSSVSVDDSNAGNPSSKCNQVVGKGDCSDQSSSDPDNLPPASTKEEKYSTELEIESDQKCLSENEPGQLARLELTELDFQDDAELSVPPPPFRHAHTANTTAMLIEDCGVQSTHTSPAKAVYPSPVKSVYSSPLKSLQSSPLKSLQSSPTKSTRSSPDLKHLEISPSPTKEEPKPGTPRGRRRQLTPTLGNTSNDQSDIISKEAPALESPASEEKEDDVKLNIPNLRSRRSAASTPVPFTTETSSESPTKSLPMPTESRVEVIDDFNFDGEAEFISRVDNNSPKHTISPTTSKAKAPEDDEARDENPDVTMTSASEAREGSEGKADISAESDEYYDALTEMETMSDSRVTETLQEEVTRDPSDPLKLKSPDESETPDCKSKDSPEQSDDDNAEVTRTTRLRQGSASKTSDSTVEDDELENSLKLRQCLAEMQTQLKSELPDGTPIALSQSDDQKEDSDSSRKGDSVEELQNEDRNIDQTLELKAQSSSKQITKAVSSLTPSPAPETELSDTSVRPLRTLRSRQSMQPTPSVEVVTPTPEVSDSTITELSDQSTTEQKKEKRKTKKLMLDLINKIMNMRDIGDFMTKLQDRDEKFTGIVKEDVDLVTLKLRVEANGLDSFDELIRCLGLMFLNHFCVRPEEERESIKRTATDVWTLLEEDSASMDLMANFSILSVPVPEVEFSTPIASRSRLSSTSSTASSRRSKTGKKKEEGLPARELRKSSFQKPTETPPSSYRGRKSESSDRAVSPPIMVEDKPKAGGSSKRKRLTRVSTPEPESPSPPPEETKKLRSRQSQGRPTTPVPPPKKTPNNRGKRTRAT